MCCKKKKDKTLPKDTDTFLLPFNISLKNLLEGRFIKQNFYRQLKHGFHVLYNFHVHLKHNPEFYYFNVRILNRF